jgi:hypothetical protein
MEKFPKLKPSQVVLVRSDYDTGIVLDENLAYATGKKQKVHTIFDSIQDGLEQAKVILTKKDKIECTIYDEDQKVIYFLRSIEDLDKILLK